MKWFLSWTIAGDYGEGDGEKVCDSESEAIALIHQLALRPGVKFRLIRGVEVDVAPVEFATRYELREKP